MAVNKVASLEKAVEESENKGSYLMKLIHLRENLAKFDALGNYPALFDRLDAVEKRTARYRCQKPDQESGNQACPDRRS